ncbi:MAG: cell division protein ZapA [Polyangiaceae bacterium]
MSKEAVELTVAGQTCRVVTTASRDELEKLADMVESKLSAIIAPGRPVTTQAMLLAAIALANDVCEERARATKVTSDARATMESLLRRVEDALGDSATTPETSPPRVRAATPSAAPTVSSTGEPAGEAPRRRRHRPKPQTKNADDE